MATRKSKPKETEPWVQVGGEPVPGIRLRCICRGHKRAIRRIAWSPCGRLIASPSEDKTIRIWDAKRGECLAILKGHKESVNCVAWSPNSKRLISGSSDRTIRLWNTTVLAAGKAQKVGRSQILRQHYLSVICISWSSNGTMIAFGDNGNYLSIYDVKIKQVLVTEKLSGSPFSLAWSPDSTMLAVGHQIYHRDRPEDITIVLWDAKRNKITQKLAGHKGNVHGVSWSHDGSKLASGSYDSTIKLWDPSNGGLLNSFEGHTGSIHSVVFSPKNEILVSKSADETLRIWDAKNCRELVSLPEPRGSAYVPSFQLSMAFDPVSSALASFAEGNCSLRIWDLDLQSLMGMPQREPVIRNTSAKIVLVGESNVGKSCLAMRLCDNRYPNDHEQGTTHGMRVWPLEAQDLHPSAHPPEGQRRDIVLWDFGGQDEYHLVHQMFLSGTTLALVLIDPTRGRTALDEARDWNRRLEKHLDNDRAVKLLIGAKVDRPSNRIDLNSIKALCQECGFKTFLDLSAKTDRNIQKLRKVIADSLQWEQIARTSRPELFQHIRDEVERRRQANEIVLTLTEFKAAIKQSAAGMYEEAAVDAVSEQLATQGIIARTQLTGGDEALVLQVPVIERYAGSLIMAARNNPRGVPVLEGRLLGSTQRIPLPGMTAAERLNPIEERVVLECIVELMIHHGICFRHGGLLVFPTLFPAGSMDGVKQPYSISLYYDYTGDIDHIYASLVSTLMVSEAFGEGRLQAGCVEFERKTEGVCGVRQARDNGGVARLELFFSEQTPLARRDLFTRFVKEHLQSRGGNVYECQAIQCQCGEEIAEHTIQKRMAAGAKDVACPVCETRILIGEGGDRIRQRNPETDKKINELRDNIKEKQAADIKSAKQAVAGESQMAMEEDPIRILHLSDLHFTAKTNPTTMLQLLLQDLQQPDGHYGTINTVEYLVISGDITNKGQTAGFETARQFVKQLVEELDLSNHRCIFVPGNHDVQDREDAYEEREDESGNPINVRHPQNFQKRFEQFSNGFYHPLLQKNYPLNYTHQGIPYLYPETGIQFLTLNSAWEIDKNGRKKAGIHPDAVANVIAQANDKRQEAMERGDLQHTQPLLRIGVWHHAVAGPELMRNLEFLTQLQRAGVRLCLHGDVHEPRAELFRPRQPGIAVEILGAGSFGSPPAGRPESTPRLYNLLEVFVDPQTKQHQSIRVHTREQRKGGQAWQGYYAWPMANGTGQLPYYDINL